MKTPNKKELFGDTSLAEKLSKAKDSLEGGNITENIKENKLQKLPQKIELKKNITPKLFVSGRLDRKRFKYIAHSLVLPREMETEIKSYCRGSELAVLNYLIKEGLKKIKESKHTINIDTEEIYSEI